MDARKTVQIFDETVDILLSTFNGEKYLSEQINSLLKQTHKRWRLLVRDDGSSDNTLTILKDYMARYPSKIIFVNGPRHLGVCQSFAHLLRHATSDYVMFCDQDDVWLPEKIVATLNKILEMEEIYGKKIPLLVHTDLVVVDADLHVMSTSYWRYQNLNPKISYVLNRLLCQNVVTGCTVMVNRSLQLKVTLVPDAVPIHDWWLALIAVTFGKIDYLSKSYIYYRQHSNNEIGAKSLRFKYIIKRLFSLNQVKSDFYRSSMNAKAFLDVYKEDLNDEQCQMIEAYSKLHSYNFFHRIYLIFKYQYFKSGVIRNLGMMFV